MMPWQQHFAQAHVIIETFGFSINKELVDAEILLQNYKFQTLIGLSKRNFEDLVTRLEKSSLISTSDDACKKASFKKQLAITLLYLRQGVTFPLLSWIFEMSEATVKEYTTKIINKLYDYFRDEITFPKFDVRKETKKRYQDRDVAVIIDGVEQPIHSPIDRTLSSVTFSGKKKRHTVTKLICVLPTGRICYLSPSYFGSITDGNLASMPENNIAAKLKENEWIMADRGFRGLEHRKIFTYTNLTPFSLQKKFKKIRVRVENTIGEVKKWKICSMIFPSRIGTWGRREFLRWHDKIWVVCGGLVNVYLHPE
jgi:hypothetical protein